MPCERKMWVACLAALALAGGAGHASDGEDPDPAPMETTELSEPRDLVLKVAPAPPGDRAGTDEARRTTGRPPELPGFEVRASGEASRFPGTDTGWVTGTASGGGSLAWSSPAEVAGPVSLTLGKTPNGDSWDLNLSWSGQTGATNVSYSIDPTFQEGLSTLEKGLSATVLTVAEDPDETLECFDVTDDTTLSRAVQGLGYDPDPRPRDATIDEGTSTLAAGSWWNEEIIVSADYLDKIPPANYLGFQHRMVRAHEVVTGSGGYAEKAKFLIPVDGRSFWVAPHAFGRSSSSASHFHYLYPKGIGPFTNLRNITYDETVGHVWVAADNIVQEVDVFRASPATGATFTDAAKPYLSRESDDGRILYVDGTLGVTTVYQIDVATGVRTVYASTTDLQFNRPIRPVGIAVARFGAYCYIADASPGPGASKVVRIPAGNSGDIIDDYGSWPYWGFPDPAGMETDYKGQVFMAASNNWVGKILDESTTYWAWDTSGPALSIFLDRDISTSSTSRLFWSETAGWTHAYNQNPLDGGAPARYHGAVLEVGDGKILVAPQWDYSPYDYHVLYPHRVILNNAGTSTSYPYPYQVGDRLVKLHVYGWASVPLHVRLIDPPDLSPYAPDGGWPARGGRTAVPPYEANDNDVWDDHAYTDFGLTIDPGGALGGPGPVLDLNVTPGGDWYATFYLKLPERYAGDNWQIEVTKCNAYGTPIPTRVGGLSGVFTGWKRGYAERERMFREGGVLSSDASQGDRYIYLARIQDGGGSWIRADKLIDGDLIAIFDNAHRFDGGKHDTACVHAVTDWSEFEMRVELGAAGDCQPPYELEHAYKSSIDPVTHQWTFAAGTKGAGVGSYGGCSTDPNVIDPATSCFFYPDMRNLEKPFGEACMEWRGPRSGMGSLPYVPRRWFEAATKEDMARMSQVWFANFTAASGNPPDAQPHNYFHLIGASDNTNRAGRTHPDWDYTYIFAGEIETQGRPPGETRNWVQSTTAHELAHQLDVNADDCGGHDSRDAWCASNPLLDCYLEKCLMDPGRDRVNGIEFLCQRDLLDGAPDSNDQHCGDPPPGGFDIEWEEGDGAIRTEADPK